MLISKDEVRNAIKDIVLKDADVHVVTKNENRIDAGNNDIHGDVFEESVVKNFPYVTIKRNDEGETCNIEYRDTQCGFVIPYCILGEYSINSNLMRFRRWLEYSYNGEEPIDTIILIPDIRIRLEIAPYDEMDCLVMLLRNNGLVDVISNIEVERKFIEVVTKI